MTRRRRPDHRAAGIEWIGARIDAPLAGPGARFDCVLWHEMPTDLVLALTPVEPDQPTTAAEELVKLLTAPLPRGAHRPGRIRVADEGTAAEIRAALPGLEVVVAPTPEVDDVLEHMAGYAEKQRQAPLPDLDALTGDASPEELQRVYALDEALTREMFAIADSLARPRRPRPGPQFGEGDLTVALAVAWTAYHYRLDGRLLVDRLLEDLPRDVPAAVRGWLERQRRTWLSLWQVEAATPGRNVTMRDLLTGERRVVRDKLASESAVVGSVMLGRIVDVSASLSVFGGAHERLLAPLAGESLVAIARRSLGVPCTPVLLCEEEATTKLIRLWARAIKDDDARRAAPPRLVNRAGHAVLITTDHFAFDADSRGRIIDALGTLPGAERASDGEDVVIAYLDSRKSLLGQARVSRDTLALTCDSVERSDSLCAQVKNATGALLRHRAREHSDPTAMMDQAPARAPAAEAPAEVERELKARFYADWLDEPIPVLGGKSPRQAVRSRAGRAKTETVLREIEYREAKLPADRRADVAALRTALGLVKPAPAAPREVAATREPPPMNEWCRILEIDSPRLSAVVGHREANTYALLLVVLLERGEPMTLEEVATRLAEEGLGDASDLLLSLKRCKPGRPPVIRDGDRYLLDPHSQDLDLWAFRLGLRPAKIVAMPKEAPAPLPDDSVPLTPAELDEAWRGQWLLNWSAQRLALAVLDASGGPLAPAEVVAAVSERTPEHLLRVDAPMFGNRNSAIAILDDGRWAVAPGAERLVRTARRAVRDRIVMHRRYARPSPEELEEARCAREQLRQAHRAEVARLSRALVVAFPPARPEAAALVDIGKHEVRSFVGSELRQQEASQVVDDVIGGVAVRALLRALGVDPGSRRLVELSPAQKTRQLNRRGRTLKITTAMLVQGSCRISRPFGEPRALAGYLAAGEETKLRRRLEADVKSLHALHEYGRLHGAVRIRWGFLDERIEAPWSDRDEENLYELIRAAGDRKSPLEVVVGSAPGWEEPWARVRRATVETDANGWHTRLVGDDGSIIDPHDVQLARLP